MSKTAIIRDSKDVEAFILLDLPKKLKRDLRNLQIIKEADLECAAYFHLRRYLSKDVEWKVLARKYVPWTGRYIDLLIFRKTEPVFALELKWAKDEISDKDRCSLKSALKDLGAKKAFWICAQPNAETGVERYYGDSRRELHIFIRPGLQGADLEKWLNKRKDYMADMDQGERVRSRVGER